MIKERERGDNQVAYSADRVDDILTMRESIASARTLKMCESDEMIKIYACRFRWYENMLFYDLRGVCY